MRTLSTALSLGFGDQARLLTAAALLVTVSVGVVVGSFARLRDLLLWAGDAAAPVVPGDPTPARVAGAVDVADRGLPGDRTCLVRSLTAETLLRLYGYTPVHRIGVDTAVESGMKAHSWLEYGDDILIGEVEDLSRFTPLPPLDEDGES
ncbi:lasso peptide biosynthesis B2 protein [Candidatus Halobonum tyrrellensis]|uniref:Microcin J25-processing protein McjB C-terminal domain-containing protein n=1 Tax=Candidatus Halobonum tyrrellensis G22 TaxID=1324957 RepID=V4HH05_9EURY|nr:lasso peptide biosynthesis B2 protein [Candidatus Halobonum tyrrellensis]ESP90005.1 hypothetical protein K933_00542 [Candidatus Halobonum tyrrellensis G22]